MSRNGILFNVSKREKALGLAAQTLIELRTKLQITQQEFAVKLAEIAVTTVARWESDNPPARGETLLRLSEISDANGCSDLGDRFRYLYVDEILDRLYLRGLIQVNTETEKGDTRGYIIRRLEGSGYLVLKFDRAKSVRTAIHFLEKQIHTLGLEEGESKQ